MTDAVDLSPEPSQPQAPQPELSAEADRAAESLAYTLYRMRNRPLFKQRTYRTILALIRSEVARATREQAEEIARLKVALSSEDIAYRDCLARLNATESNIVALARAVESALDELRHGISTPRTNAIDRLDAALAEADVDTSE